MACASKIGKRLGCFLPRPGLIPEVDGNGSGGPENRQGCIRERLKVRNLTKPKTPVGQVVKGWGILLAGEVVGPTFQTSGLAGLQGDWNSRLLGATGRLWPPIPKVNPPDISRNLQVSVRMRFYSVAEIVGMLCEGYSWYN